MARVRTAVFISGGGSNMAALVKAARDPAYPAEIVRVVSNEPAAGGIEKARTAGIETEIVDHRRFPDRAAFDAALDESLQGAGAEIVCLAGFMRLLTAPFIERWRDRMLNIHPALLPSFKGLHTHERAIRAGAKRHGCTVHLVRPAMDTGPILLQADVPVRPDDTPDALAARVLEREHVIYPRALQWLAEGRVRVVGDDRVVVRGVPPARRLKNRGLPVYE